MGATGCQPVAVAAASPTCCGLVAAGNRQEREREREGVTWKTAGRARLSTSAAQLKWSTGPGAELEEEIGAVEPGLYHKISTP